MVRSDSTKDWIKQEAGKVKRDNQSCNFDYHLHKNQKKELIMSNEYNTALKMGATAPFNLVMALSKPERAAFISAVTPNLFSALKSAALKGA